MIKLLTLYCRRFKYEDNNFIYYENEDSLTVTDYIVDYIKKDDDNITIIKIIFNDNNELYFKLLDGYSDNFFDNNNIPTILHKKFFNGILTYLNDYMCFYNE